MGGIVSSVGGALGGLFGVPKAPPMPILKEPTVMPTADDAAVRAAKRKAASKQIGRSGRQSTILSEDDYGIGKSDTLG